MNCMPKLNELVTASHSLQNGKVTERKKAIEQITSLIKNSEVVAFLNTSTSSKNVSWTSLFESAIDNLLTDAQSFLEAKQSAKPGTISTRQQKMKLSCGFLKRIVNAANKGYPHIKLVKILPAVIRILDMEEFVKCLGNTFINILKNDIICRRKYACQMLTTDYQQAIAILMELFDQQDVDKSSLSKCLLTVIKALTHHCDPHDFIVLYKFLVDTINRLSEDGNSTVIESIMVCTNIVVEWMSISFRSETVKFLEDVFDCVLAQWKGKHLHSIMLKFFHLQLEIHHPNMSITTAQNCVIFSKELWPIKLKQLLIVLEKHFVDLTTKSSFKFRKEPKTNTDNEFYVITGYVLHVLCQLNKSDKEISQNISPLNSTMCTQKPTTSFSAIESYSRLVEVICVLDGNNLLHVLSVICSMQEKFPGLMTTTNLEDLCGNILKILGESYNREIQKLCIKILFYSVIDLKSLQTSLQMVELNWKQIWVTSKRLINQNPSTEEADLILKLLSVLIECDNLSQKQILNKDIIQDMLPLIYSHVLPSSSALAFVQLYITSYDICMKTSAIEKRCNTLFEQDQQRVFQHQFKNCVEFKLCAQNYPFKILLLDWLLKYKEELVVLNLNPNATFTTQRVEPDIRSMALMHEFNLMKTNSQDWQHVVIFLETLFSKEMIDMDTIDPLKERNMLKDCFDITFVNSWLSFQQDVGQDILSKSVKDSLKSYDPPLIIIFQHGVKHNMKLLNDSISSYDNFIHWATNNLSSYISFCQILVDVIKKIGQFLPKDIVKSWHSDAQEKFGHAKEFVLQYLEEISGQIWIAADLLPSADKIIMQFAKLTNSFDNATEQSLIIEIAVWLKNILLKGITSNNSQSFKKYSYEMERSSEGASDGFDSMGDDDSLSPPLAADDFFSSTLLSSTSKKRKYSFTQSGPMSKRPSSDRHQSKESNQSNSSKATNTSGILCTISKSLVDLGGDVDTILAKLTFDKPNLLNLNNLYVVECLLSQLSKAPSSDNQTLKVALNTLSSIVKVHFHDLPLCGNFLHLMCKIIESVGEKISSENFEEIIRLLEGFRKLILSNTIPTLSAAFVETVAEVLKAIFQEECLLDTPLPNSFASVVISKPSHMLYSIIQFLSDTSVSVRLCSALALQKFFTDNLLLPTAQELIIKSLQDKIKNCCETLDETFLVAIAMSYPIKGSILLPSAVYLFCRSIEKLNLANSMEHAISKLEISKACSEYISSRQHLTVLNAISHFDSSGLVISNLTEILQKWLSDESSISFKSFPYYLCDCDSFDEFVAKYQKELISVVASKAKSAKLLHEFVQGTLYQQRCGDISKITEKLIVKYFPTIINQILNASVGNQQNLENSISILRTVLKSCNIENILMENFSPIFTEVTSERTCYHQPHVMKTKLELFMKAMKHNITQKHSLLYRINEWMTLKCLKNLPSNLLHLRTLILSSTCLAHLHYHLENYVWVTENLLIENKNQKQISCYLAYDMGFTLSHSLSIIVQQLNQTKTFQQTELLSKACLTVLSCLRLLLNEVFQNKHLAFCNFDWNFTCTMVRSIYSIHKHNMTNDSVNKLSMEVVQFVLDHRHNSYSGRLLQFLLTPMSKIVESNCLEYALETCQIIQFIWNLLIESEIPSSDTIIQLLNIGIKSFDVCINHHLSCMDRCESTKTYKALMSNTPQSPKIKIKLATLLGKLTMYLQYDLENTNEVESNYKTEVLRQLVIAIFSPEVKLAESAYTTLCNIISLPDMQTHIPNVSSGAGKVLQAFKTFNVNRCNVKTIETDLISFLQDNKLNNCLHPCHKTWICDLVFKLTCSCTDNTLKLLSDTCKTNLQMSKHLLPWVVRSIILVNFDEKIIQPLSNFINSFSNSVVKHSAIKTNCLPNKYSACCIIELVQFLRHQEANKSTHRVSAWDQNFWLNIDYLNLAEMALYCGLYHYALLFAEIWINSFELKMEKCIKSKSDNRRQSTARTSRALTFSEDFVVIEEPNSQKLREHFIAERFLGSRRPLEILKFLENDTNVRVKHVLINATSNLKNLDYLCGITYGENLNPISRAFNLLKEERFIESLQLNDIIASNTSGLHQGSGVVLQALYSCGFDHIASCYIQQIEGDKNKIKLAQDLQWKSVWKLSKWDAETSKDDDHFHAKYHSCLKMIDKKDTVLTEKYFKECKLSVIDSLANSCINTNLLIPNTSNNLTRIVFINEAEDATTNLDLPDKEFRSTIEKWGFSSNLYMEVLPNIDDILHSRTCLYKMFMNTRKDSDDTEIRKSFIEHLLNFSRRALKAGNLQLALHQLCALKQSPYLKDFETLEHNILECQLLWESNDRMKALSLSQSSIERLSSQVVDTDTEYLKQHLLLAQTLLIRGKWLKESQSASSETIMEECLMKSVEIVKSLHSDKQLCIKNGIDWNQVEEVSANAHYDLATFADKEYRNIVEYMKSPEFEQKTTLVKNAKHEIQQAQLNGGGESRKYLVFLQRNYRIDQGDLQSILEKKEKFLLSALEHYVRCLSSSDDNDILMYRVCSLWFENFSNQSVPGFLDCAWSTIPSHKYVALVYQLAARLGKVTNENKKFQATLRKILVKVCTAHPHHVLPVILALSNAHKDYDFTAKKTSKKKKELDMDERVKAANEVLKSVNKKCQMLIANYQTIFNAYIQMAYLDTTPWSQKPPMSELDIPKSMALLQLTKMSSAACKALSNIVIPTVNTPIDRNENYDLNITFSHFKPHFKLCGGINVPKVLVAVSSDGKENKHLVKGRDDLRQDTVMQQVFSVVNSLLSKDKGRCKPLKIRTYKVLPLSQRSGLVEWCEGTLPIGTYLLGTPKQSLGAHQIYRPNDKLASECRRALSNASKDPFMKKYAVFSELCKQFKPVMKYFFFEKFKDPYTWFEKRRLYSDSVATSSIVGYVLGLGDRHVQNILIDCETAELVHIDFGVAFEQGKCLPTPETVPFRLSRDIADGFGITGVEGPFRKTCEHTLKVLREDSDTILTIIEVLLHDPLHDWVLTPVKAMNIQRNLPSVTDTMQSTCNPNHVLNASTVDQLLLENDPKGNAGSDDRSSLAGRALLRVREKLQGVENNSVLSIEGQVNLLIQQATDAKKLCMLFAGWQPYV